MKLSSIINWELHQKLQKPRKIETHYRYGKQYHSPIKFRIILLTIVLGAFLSALMYLLTN